ncbi:MAG: hypothetical protein ACLFVG_10075 [Candidatus Aminicenantes bacterium]
MFGAKKWEVSFYSDMPKDPVMSKNFRTLRRAERYMREHLGKDEKLYCATIWRRNSSQFYAFYWNGSDIIYWDRPWVLSSRQARNLEIDEYGDVVMRPPQGEQD